MMDLLESVSLDGFQVVQKQFFETPNEPLVTIWEDAIGFSAAAYQALENCSTIKIMINAPRRAMLVVPASPQEQDAVRWKHTDTICKFKKFSCASFSRKLMKTWGLNSEYKYRCYGRIAKVDERVVLYFDFNTAIPLPNKKKG